MIYLTVTKTKKLLQDATIHVEWHPVDESIRDLSYHGNTFPFGTTDAELSVYESTIAIPGIVSAINAYLGQSLYTAILPLNDYIDNAVLSAILFGDKIMAQFKRENILMGISSTDKIPYVHEFFHNLNHLLGAGSAKEAIQELNRLISLPDSFVISYNKLNVDGTMSIVNYTKLELAPFITSVRLTNFKNQIQDFYGMPRT